MNSVIDTPGPSSAPGWTRRRVLFLSISAAVAVGVLFCTSEVLLPFALAIIVAYVLAPAVAACERLRMPRAVAILFVYAVTGATFYFAIAAMAPRIVDETMKLARETPTVARNLATEWGPVVEKRVREIAERAPHVRVEPPPPAVSVQPTPDGGFSIWLGSGVDLIRESDTKWRVRPVRPGGGEFSVAELLSEAIDETINYVKENVFELIRLGQAIIRHVTRSIFLTFMTIMVAGYIMYTRDEIIDFFRSLPPARARPSFDRLLFRLDRGLAGVVRGQLVIMAVNGVLSALGFWMFGLKYWPILALVAGLMSIIPIFGSILSTIPAVLVGLTQDFWTALWVLLWIIGIHQIEANLLNPNIIGVAAKLHPALVVFSLIVGEHYYGLWGALLAVPALSVVKSVFNHFRYESLPDAPADSIAFDLSGGPRRA